jgi:hypothetical protein
MIDRRLRAIRFWLIFMAVALSCCLYPSSAIYLSAFYAWTPLGLFMPVFAVVPCDCTSCSVCNVATQVQIVVTGIVEGTCGNCNTLNTTYTVPLSLNPCVFTQNIVGSPCGALSIAFVWGGAGFPTNTRATMTATLDPGAIVWDTGNSGPPQDCTVNPDAISFDSETGSIICDASGSTATVTLL